MGGGGGGDGGIIGEDGRGDNRIIIPVVSVTYLGGNRSDHPG
jgi:hypothetical protein